MSGVCVLHVDDDPDYGDLVAAFFKRESERLSVVTETSVADALDRLAATEESIDCIVSDYDMPGTNGLEFLAAVRENHPDLPFILFTGKGSEEVASEAIAAGATDYLRKKSGSERYELLANRIENAVEQYRSRQERERRLERQNERFDDLAEVVSHDLQTPLSTARGRLELALESGDDAHVEEAIAALDRVDQLRSELVDVLRTREIVRDVEPVAVGAALKDACASVESLSEAAIDVEDDTIVQADPDAIVRLFENLLSNSVEHGAQPDVRLGTTEDGIYYEDDGPGIDPAIRDEVFSPGFSTKEGSGGGMGLTSVRQIVAAHDWDVEIRDARVLDGVRFEFSQ